MILANAESENDKEKLAKLVLISEPNRKKSATNMNQKSSYFIKNDSDMTHCSNTKFNERNKNILNKKARNSFG